MVLMDSEDVMLKRDQLRYKFSRVCELIRESCGISLDNLALMHIESRCELRPKFVRVSDLIRDCYGASLDQLDSERISYHLDSLIGEVYEEVFWVMTSEERNVFWGKLRAEAW